jgi:methylase of polypeptide subunit release factors
MESESERNARLLASLQHSLRLAKATNRELLDKAHRSLDDLAQVTAKHKTSIRELVTKHLPAHDPTYVPHPDHVEMAEKLDQLISARSLPPMKPSNLMSRIINQRI